MRVLVVEDDQKFRLDLKHYLETPDALGTGMPANHVTAAPTFTRAMEIVGNGFDVAFIDLDLGQGYETNSGFEILKHIKKEELNIVPIMSTGQKELKVIERCLRMGAADYIMKPYDPAIVHLLMTKAIIHQQVFRCNRALREQAGKDAPRPIRLTTKSPAFQDVLNLGKRFAGSGKPIFVGGEPGVGKGVMARYLWTLEEDEKRPFVSLHCGGIASNLIESELFGHVKGAFTGADHDKMGKFEAADGGDIFLDEIGTAPAEVQVKLLRVLQEKVVERVGSTTARGVDVRVISATNANLERLAREGKFRDDLIDRLGVVKLEIPPLRERMEDLEDLAFQFLRSQAHVDKRLSDDAWKLCRGYNWPGNVRELEHAITAAASLAEGATIAAKDILPFLKKKNSEEQPVAMAPKGLVGPGPYGLSDEAMNGMFDYLSGDFEREMVRYALDKTGSPTEAARFLGITRHKLDRRRQVWGWTSGDDSL